MYILYLYVLYVISLITNKLMIKSIFILLIFHSLLVFVESEMGWIQYTNAYYAHIKTVIYIYQSFYIKIKSRN
jgi:hypothetical protein